MNKSIIESVVLHSGAKNRSDLARKLAIHRSLVSHWEHGNRPIPPAMCKRIELLTTGKVPRSVLRPDIFL